MTSIHVAFLDGFQNDDVVVHIGGAEVYRRSGLKTRMQIGLAGKVSLQAVPGRNEVRVSVPTQNAEVSIPLDVPAARAVYLGISVGPPGVVTYKVSNDPFLYA